MAVLIEDTIESKLSTLAKNPYRPFPRISAGPEKQSVLTTCSPDDIPSTKTIPNASESDVRTKISDLFISDSISSTYPKKCTCDLLIIFLQDFLIDTEVSQSRPKVVYH